VKTFRRILPILPALTLLGPIPAGAQQRFLLQFQGVTWTTNKSGSQIITGASTTRTWLKNYAQVNGLSNPSALGLAYHLNGSINGDTIDVIDSTGNSIDILYGFYLGLAGGRTALVNSNLSQIKLLQYVFSSTNVYTIGSGIITELYTLDSSGNTNKTAISGLIQFQVPPTAASGLSFCTGTFVTGKQLP
jgi:hypothetical protein